ncbi:MAG: hypothetical protein ACREIU_04980, partial [Planctomycetota bacterium]
GRLLEVGGFPEVAGPVAVDPRTVRRTLRANAQRLLGLPGVVFLAVGRKVRRGAPGPPLSVRVFVRRKYGARGRNLVPPLLRAVGPGGRRLPAFVPTDVEAEPLPPRVLAADGGCGVVGAMRGALGLAYRTAAGRVGFVTNAHVVAGFDARAIGERVDLEETPARRIGVVLRTIPIRSGLASVNRFDASFVRATAPIVPYSVGGTGIVGPAPLSVGRKGRYFYVSRGARKEGGDLNEVATPLPVWMEGRVARFVGVWRLRLEDSRAEVGDSGSLLLLDSPEGWRACGLVFAGRGGVAYAIPLATALAALSGPGASEDGVGEDVRVAWPPPGGRVRHFPGTG